MFSGNGRRGRGEKRQVEQLSVAAEGERKRIEKREGESDGQKTEWKKQRDGRVESEKRGVCCRRKDRGKSGRKIMEKKKIERNGGGTAVEVWETFFAGAGRLYTIRL